MREKAIELRKQGMSYKEISEITGYAKDSLSYIFKKENLFIGNTTAKLSTEDIIKMRELFKFKTRSELAKMFNISPATVSYHCGIRGKTKDTPEERKAKNVKAVSNRRKILKEELVKYKGGSCERCSYNKFMGALEFHHLDPNEKDFGLSTKGLTKSLDKLKKEVDKCILLCANCHREVHEEERVKTQKV